MLVALPFFLTFLVSWVYSLIRIFVQFRLQYLLVFLVFLLPIYETLQILIFQLTGSALFVSGLKAIKDLMIFGSVAVLLLSHRNVLQRKFKLITLDYFFIIFYALALFFLIAPIGEATFSAKLLYFKNLLMMGVMYFFGRNVVLSKGFVRMLSLAFFGVMVAAFLVATFEKLTNTHFQSIIGFTRYLEYYLEDTSTGYYGLTWTFQAGGGAKRFASFFANPLYYAATCVLMFSFAVYHFLRSSYQNNRLVYLGLMFIAVLSLIFSHSRSSFGSLFLMMACMALLFGYYRLIFWGVTLLALGALYLLFLADEEFLYYVQDTLTLADSSSIGHVIEWFEAIESMISNPMGLGLATSGNVSGVEGDLRIGGENQFLIFGVQMGFLGLVIYVCILTIAIWKSVKAYFLAKDADMKLVPFVAATFKVALLLPLMTSNAENYALTSYLSWWFVGFSASMDLKGSSIWQNE